MSPVNLVYEGLTDEIVLRRIFQHLQLPPPITRSMGGKARLLRNLERYNQAAKYTGHWVIVIDLDREAETATQYVQRLLPDQAEQLIMCVAVQAIESWLLADREHFADYLSIPLSRLPLQPDREDDPKQTVIQLARLCKTKDIQEDILPPQDGTATIGPGYVNRVAEFVNQSKKRWRPGTAADVSPSLAVCLDLLKPLRG